MWDFLPQHALLCVYLAHQTSKSTHCARNYVTHLVWPDYLFSLRALSHSRTGLSWSSLLRGCINHTYKHLWVICIRTERDSQSHVRRLIGVPVWRNLPVSFLFTESYRSEVTLLICGSAYTWHSPVTFVTWSGTTVWAKSDFCASLPFR